MKDIDKEIDNNSSQETETAAPADKLSGLFGKLAAIYHGVPEEELINDQEEAEPPVLLFVSPPHPFSAATEESANVNAPVEVADSIEPPADAPVEPLAEQEIPQILPVKIHVNQASKPGEEAENDADRMSRRQARKEREEQLLYLDEEEAQLQIRRELRRREQNRLSSTLPTLDPAKPAKAPAAAPKITSQRPVYSSYYRPTPASRRRFIAITASIAALVLLVVIFFVLVRNMPKNNKQVDVSYQSTLEKLDYITANSLYIAHADRDENYHDQALELLNDQKAVIVDAYINGQSTYDTAYDELATLGLFMPLWPETERNLHNSLALNSASALIDPFDIMADSFAAIDSYKEQERKFRIGQQLLNLDMNAMAIPYLRDVADKGGSLGGTAADQLRRSESTFLVNVVNSAQTYKAAGDVLRARLVLESAALVLKDSSEIQNLLEGLPPVDQGKLLLDISAMAMTYFDAQRYHESLLIVDVGRNYLNDLVALVESGASLANFTDQIDRDQLDTVLVNQGDQALRSGLADSLRRDIESLDQLETRLRESIITELRAEATQYSDQGKYREARDTMDVALEFEPDDEQLKELRTEYHNKTRLRISSFINRSTAKGFRIEKVKEVSDQNGATHEDVIRIGSSNYAPALKLSMLPHRHNRFQGVFYLMDAGDAVNVQIVVHQEGTEIYRSAPLNSSTTEVSFDFLYDFSKDMSIDLLGSGTGTATRYNRMDGITMLLDAYFYNDGTWDETNATKLHAQYVADKEVAAKAQETKLNQAHKIDLYDELLNDSMWNSIFGHDALLRTAKDSKGSEHAKVLSIKGRSIVQVKADTDYLRGRMYFAENSSIGSGLILMIEDETGRRWFSDILSDEQTVVDLNLPVNGDFNLMLLTTDGKRVERNSFEVLIKAQLYDYEQTADSGAPSIDGLEPTGASTESTSMDESGRNPEGGRGN